MAIHKKLAEYREEQVNLERRSDKKFSFNDAKYPEISKKIEKFVNRTKEFPDFFDIKKEVEEVNKKKNLMLTDMKVHTEAERMFVAIGRKLKRRRFDDDAAVMYSYLQENDPGDPACKDFELDRKLDDLGKVAKKKLDTVFEQFVEKQVNKVSTNSEEDIDDGPVKESPQKNLLSEETRGLLQKNDFDDDTDDESPNFKVASGVKRPKKNVIDDDSDKDEPGQSNTDYRFGSPGLSGNPNGEEDASDLDDSKNESNGKIDSDKRELSLLASLQDEDSQNSQESMSQDSNVDDLLDSMSESED